MSDLRVVSLRHAVSRQASPIDVEIIAGGGSGGGVVVAPPSHLLVDAQQVVIAVGGQQVAPPDGQQVAPAAVLSAVLPPHPAAAFRLDAPHFEPVGIDPFQVDGLPPGGAAGLMTTASMDSPNFGIDYGQQVTRRERSTAFRLLRRAGVNIRVSFRGCSKARLNR